MINEQRYDRNITNFLGFHQKRTSIQVKISNYIDEKYHMLFVCTVIKRKILKISQKLMIHYLGEIKIKKKIIWK